MEIYVGNLDLATTSAELRSLFEAFGDVTRADVYPVGRCAFARMEMPDDTNGQAAIDHLFGTELHGQKIVVAECSGNQGDFVDEEYDDLEDEE